MKKQLNMRELLSLVRKQPLKALTESKNIVEAEVEDSDKEFLEALRKGFKDKIKAIITNDKFVDNKYSFSYSGNLNNEIFYSYRFENGEVDLIVKDINGESINVDAELFQQLIDFKTIFKDMILNK